MNFGYKRGAKIISEILPSLGVTTMDLRTLKDILFTTQDNQFPIALHFGMFMVQIHALGSDEQVAYWKPKA